VSCVICGKWGCTEHVGNKGLRYEVRFIDGNKQERVFGWAGSLEGVASFVKAIGLHPVHKFSQAIDRQTGEKVEIQP
jgi:hypothetical protein